MTALQGLQSKKVGIPFMAKILDDSEVHDHAQMKPLIGKVVTVHDVVPTKKGPALKFRTARGITMQILACFAEIVPHSPFPSNNSVRILLLGGYSAALFFVLKFING